MMLFRWFFTVFSLMRSAAAISLLTAPRVSSSTTSRSRGLMRPLGAAGPAPGRRGDPGGGGGGGGGGGEPLPAKRPPGGGGGPPRPPRFGGAPGGSFPHAAGHRS